MGCMLIFFLIRGVMYQSSALSTMIFVKRITIINKDAAKSKAKTIYICSVENKPNNFRR